MTHGTGAHGAGLARCQTQRGMDSDRQVEWSHSPRGAWGPQLSRTVTERKRSRNKQIIKNIYSETRADTYGDAQAQHKRRPIWPLQRLFSFSPQDPDDGVRTNYKVQCTVYCTQHGLGAYKHFSDSDPPVGNNSRARSKRQA